MCYCVAGCAVDHLRPRLRRYVAGREGLYPHSLEVGKRQRHKGALTHTDISWWIAESDGQASEDRHQRLDFLPHPTTQLPYSLALTPTHPQLSPSHFILPAPAGFTPLITQRTDVADGPPESVPALPHPNPLQACPLMGSSHCSLPSAPTRTGPAFALIA